MSSGGELSQTNGALADFSRGHRIRPVLLHYFECLAFRQCASLQLELLSCNDDGCHLPTRTVVGVAGRTGRSCRGAWGCVRKQHLMNKQLARLGLKVQEARMQGPAIASTWDILGREM